MIANLKEYIQIFFQKPKPTFFRHSYSQCGEDMIVQFILHTIGVSTPTYVDVGSYHPENLSNTAYFYNIGCSGINIEPNPVLFKVFEQQRPRDINLNVGVNDVAGELDFFIMSADTLSTFSREDADKYVSEHGVHLVEIIKVKTRSISDILSEYLPAGSPEFLTMDAEGVEEKILRSIDFDAWKPLVICCETISYSTTGQGVKNSMVLDYLCSKGYMVYADTYINTIFVLKSAWEKGDS
jgi:FkbM family methyltransferase